MYHYIPNCIPLCLNPKFRTLYRGAADNTPTSNAELLKLKLGLIGISDIEWVNGRFPYWIHNNFSKVEELKCSLAKVTDFEPLGALFALGRLEEADLAPI